MYALVIKQHYTLFYSTQNHPHRLNELASHFGACRKVTTAKRSDPGTSASMGRRSTAACLAEKRLTALEKLSTNLQKEKLLDISLPYFDILTFIFRLIKVMVRGVGVCADVLSLPDGMLHKKRVCVRSFFGSRVYTFINDSIYFFNV
jgi:hypothetical protein